MTPATASPPDRTDAAPLDAAVSLRISEIYRSLQGESTWAGLPCTFVRLTGCPLRCVYCDTEYAFYGGERRTLDAIVREVGALGIPLVEVTGGEPLAQRDAPRLMAALLSAGHTVLLETSGAFPIDVVPRETHIIVDVKCPSSGEQHRNLDRNLDVLSMRDEVKFVMGTREDYEFARELVRGRHLTGRCRAVLFSPVFGAIEPASIAAWMLEDRLHDVRFQVQLHKVIWPPDARGV